VRSVPKWTGSTDDARVPARVRLRVFERAGGVCHISGRKIQPGEAWEIEHVIPIALGGANDEDNLAPALVAPHRAKTALDVKAKAKAARLAKRHYGIKDKKALIPGSKGTRFKKRLDGAVVRRDG
jgi:5-methylcytosine-specific restriction enzyme A